MDEPLRWPADFPGKHDRYPNDSKSVRVNTKYTHHSCALGPDARQYDAVGVELEWKVWER